MNRLRFSLIAATALLSLGLMAAPAAAGEKRWAGSWHFDRMDALLASPCVPQGEGVCEKSVEGTFTGSYSGTDDKDIRWSLIFETPGTATLSYSGSHAQGEIAFGGNEPNQAFGAYANALIPTAIVGVDGVLDFTVGGESTDSTATAALTLDAYTLFRPARWINLIDEDHATP